MSAAGIDHRHEPVTSERVPLIIVAVGVLLALFGLVDDWYSDDTARNAFASFGGAAFGGVAALGVLVAALGAFVPVHPERIRPVGAGAALGVAGIGVAFYEAGALAGVDSTGALLTGLGAGIAGAALVSILDASPRRVGSARAWLTVLGVVALVLGSLLPWIDPASDTGSSPNGIDASSGRWFAIIVLIGALAAMGNAFTAVRFGRLGVTPLVVGVGALVVSIAFVLDQPRTRLAVGPDVEGFVDVSIAGPQGTLGVGPYVVIVAAALLVCTGLWAPRSRA